MTGLEHEWHGDHGGFPIGGSRVNEPQAASVGEHGVTAGPVAIAGSRPRAGARAAATTAGQQDASPPCDLEYFAGDCNQFRDAVPRRGRWPSVVAPANAHPRAPTVSTIAPGGAAEEPCG
jgi:hypothetical protein